MDRAFLLEFCDIRINYVPCSNAKDLAQVDLILIILYSISFIAFTATLGVRAYRDMYKGKKTLKQMWNPVDWVTLLIMIFIVFRCLNLGTTRSMAYWDQSNLQLDTIVSAIQSNIYYEFFFLLFGSLTANVLLVSFVKSSFNADLFAKFKVGDREIDPTKFLKYVRVIIVLQMLIYYTLWATMGTKKLEHYLLFRRMSYLTTGCAALFLSMPILIFFSGYLFKSIEESKQLSSKKKDSSMKDNSKATRPVSQNSRAPTSESENNSTNAATPGGARPKSARFSRIQAKMRSENTKFAMLVLMVRYVTYGVYLYTGVTLFCLTFLTESFQGQPAKLLILKILVDCPFWAVNSFLIYYMTFRLI